jgi:penicillin amidase
VVGYPDHKVAVQSMALQPTKGLKAWHLLNHAGNWDQFVESMQLVDATQLNIGYADVDGNIGYWVTGAHPIRGKGDGRFPVPGWDPAYDWKGVVPFKEMPHALNPEKGYLLTCNHKIIPDDYPHHLGDVWMNGYRARRLSELIESSDKLHPNDFSRMQMDVKCLSALEFIQALDGFSPEDPNLKTVMDKLRQWDGTLSVDSNEGAMYEVFRYSIIRNLLEPVLGKDFTDHVLGIAFNPILLTDHEYFGYDTVSLIRMLGNEKSWWIEKAGGKQKLLTTSLQQTLDYLKKHLGLEMDQWKWGSLHQITFAHAIGSQKPLDKVFNRGPYPIGGDTDTPLQSAISPDNPYDNKLWSPSVRFIMDLSDLSKSVCITPVGQSGQVGSKHYDDFIPDYLNGRYHPMLFTRQQVEDNLAAKLVLEPEKK